MTKNNLLLILFLINCFSFVQSQELLDRLEGQWQIDGSDSYELWMRVTSDSLSGQGFKLINGEKHITEYLGLRRNESHYIYTARVPDQNDGRQIEFIGDITNETCIVFENMKHDFPKRIEYCIEENNLVVTVSDAAEKGFQVIMHKE